MGFADELAQVQPKRGPRCTVATIAAAMDPQDALEMEQALCSETVPSSAIRQVLKGRGIEISVNTLGRHRRRQCSCPPPEAS